MQEIISFLRKYGIELNHTTSLILVLVIILVTAIVVHIILHSIVLRIFERRAHASSKIWLKIITQNKLFHRLAFTLQGIIVSIQSANWLRHTEAGDILSLCAHLWIMLYALLSFFSLLDVVLDLSRRTSAISR